MNQLDLFPEIERSRGFAYLPKYATAFRIERGYLSAIALFLVHQRDWTMDIPKDLTIVEKTVELPAGVSVIHVIPEVENYTPIQHKAIKARQAKQEEQMPF